MAYYSPVPLHNISSRRLRSLVRLFTFKYAHERGLPFRPLTREAEDLIISYDWQNDLYALRATIRHAAIMAEGAEIGIDSLRLPTGQPPQPTDASWPRVEDAARVLMGQTLADVERELILLTLECCHGNRVTAADALDISVRTLRNKLRAFAYEGLAVPRHTNPLEDGRSRALNQLQRSGQKS